MSFYPFGTYKPHPLVGIIFRLMHYPPLSRIGQVRKLFMRWMLMSSERPYDVTVRGIRIRCHLFDNTSECSFLSPRYGRKELKLLRQVLARGGLFIDIGANIGVFTLSIADLNDVQVIAVEPNPITVERLRFNLSANQFENVNVIESVIGQSNSTTEFTIFPNDLGISGTGQRSSLKPTTKEPQIRQLPMRTLLSIIEEYEITSITALKIDVEGDEDKVLIPFFDTASRALWPRLIIIEDNRPEPPLILSRMLNNHGYRQILRGHANVILTRDRDSDHVHCSQLTQNHDR